MNLRYIASFLLGVMVFDNWTYGVNIIHQVMEFYKLKNIGSVNIFLCDMQGLNFIQEDASGWIFNNTFLSNWSLRKLKGNISHVDGVFKTQSYKIGFVLNLTCQSSIDALQTISENSLFNGSYAYTLISHLPRDKNIILLEHLRLQFDSDVTLFARNEIYDLYRTAEGSPISAVLSGNYGEIDEIVSYSPPPRWNLEGVTINATTVIKEFKWKEEGFEKFIDYNHHPEIDGLSRFALVAHRHLEYLCNFKTNLSTTPDWGYYRPEVGHFDPESMFGWLEQDKVDVGLSLSRLFPARLTIAFYSPITFNFKTSVLFRHPPAGASYDGFARPFSPTTWLVIATIVFLASLVLSIIKWRHDSVDPGNEPGYPASLLNALAIISLQGSYINSLRLPTRVLSVALHFCGLLLYTYYGAKIVGFLLTSSPRTITTVENLVENRIDMWVENVSFHRNHFESKVGASATKYYEMGIKKETRGKDKFLDLKVALRKVQKGGVSLYGQSAEMFKVIENTFSGPEICSLYTISMLDLPTSVTLRKKSPYREIYYRGLCRFIESGILDVENRRWHTRMPACIGAESNSPVALEATLIAQMIFLGGFCLTILLFVLEKMFPPRRREKAKIPGDHDFMRNGKRR